MTFQQVSRIEDRGSRIEDRGSRIEDRGSRIEDRGSGIEDRASSEKKNHKDITNYLFQEPITAPGYMM